MGFTQCWSVQGWFSSVQLHQHWSELSWIMTLLSSVEMLYSKIYTSLHYSSLFSCLFLWSCFETLCIVYSTIYIKATWVNAHIEQCWIKSIKILSRSNAGFLARFDTPVLFVSVGSAQLWIKGSNLRQIVAGCIRSMPLGDLNIQRRGMRNGAMKRKECITGLGAKGMRRISDAPFYPAQISGLSADGPFIVSVAL